MGILVSKDSHNKSPKLDDLKQLLSHSSGGRSWKFRCHQDWHPLEVLGENPFCVFLLASGGCHSPWLPWLVATSLHSVSAITWHSSSVSVFSPYKDTSCTGLRP